MRSLANLDVNEVAIHLALARVARTCTAAAPSINFPTSSASSLSPSSPSLSSWVPRGSRGRVGYRGGRQELESATRERESDTKQQPTENTRSPSSLLRSFALSLFRSFAACCSLPSPSSNRFISQPSIHTMAQPERASTSTVTGSPTQASVATAEMMSRCQRAIDHAVRTGTPRYRCVASTPSICSSSAQLHQIPRSACCSRPSLARVARRRATTGTRRSRRSGASLPRSTAATATHRNQADPQASFRVYRAQARRVGSFGRDTECWCAPTTCQSPTARSRRPYATSWYTRSITAVYVPYALRAPASLPRADCHSIAAQANIDPNNCTHLACTEIRAAMLSGECNWRREMQRGILGLRGHKQECVRRRAELSVSLHASCSDPGRAQAAVHKAWDSCFADLEPFNRIP